jgi:hypothetical protein
MIFDKIAVPLIIALITLVDTDSYNEIISAHIKPSHITASNY